MQNNNPRFIEAAKATINYFKSPEELIQFLTDLQIDGANYLKKTSNDVNRVYDFVFDCSLLIKHIAGSWTKNQAKPEQVLADGISEVYQAAGPETIADMLHIAQMALMQDSQESFFPDDKMLESVLDKTGYLLLLFRCFTLVLNERNKEQIKKAA